MEKLPHEKMISSERIFKGRVLTLRRDIAVFPNGHETVREVVEHNGAVAIAAVDENRRIYLVRQFRYPFDEEFIELPAGKLDTPDEVPLEAAHRELREETGLTADSIVQLGYICPSIAVSTEKIHLFLARGLHLGQTDPDEDEYLSVFTLPLSELYEMAKRGEIRDAKTLAILTLLLDRV